MTRIGVFFDGTGNNMWNGLAIGDGFRSQAEQGSEKNISLL